jgi:hypothetical protein
VSYDSECVLCNFIATYVVSISVALFSTFLMFNPDPASKQSAKSV